MNTLKEKIKESYNQNLLEEFLHIILTSKEIKNIEERISIIESVLKGKTQREIAKDLNVSITTVTRGSKILEKNKENCKKIFNNI